MEEGDVDTNICEQASLLVKWGGLGLRNPVATAGPNHAVSKACTAALQASLLANSPLALGEHIMDIKMGRQQPVKGNDNRYQTLHKELCLWGVIVTWNRSARQVPG